RHSKQERDGVACQLWIDLATEVIGFLLASGFVRHQLERCELVFRLYRAERLLDGLWRSAWLFQQRLPLRHRFLEIGQLLRFRASVGSFGFVFVFAEQFGEK